MIRKRVINAEQKSRNKNINIIKQEKKYVYAKQTLCNPSTMDQIILKIILNRLHNFFCAKIKTKPLKKQNRTVNKSTKIFKEKWIFSKIFYEDNKYKNLNTISERDG